jgi:hypothetical protein
LQAHQRRNIFALSAQHITQTAECAGDDVTIAKHVGTVRCQHDFVLLPRLFRASLRQQQITQPAAQCARRRVGFAQRASAHVRYPHQEFDGSIRVG